jgi:hypothetical protein
VKRKPSQADRLLDALRSAGARGICQHDFNQGSVFDGGDPIPQITRRVHDLRKNYLIASGGERNGFEVYVYEGVRTSESDRPVVLRSHPGWARAYGCRKCVYAVVPRREQACVPYACWVMPDAVMVPCETARVFAARRVNRTEQEERRAA